MSGRSMLTVEVIEFARSPWILQQALEESPELEPCRSQMRLNGKRFKFDGEAKLFAPWQQADLIVQHLQSHGVVLGGQHLFLKDFQSCFRVGTELERDLDSVLRFHRVQHRLQRRP